MIDLDIRAFFDTVPWDLVLKAVAHHTDQRWILLYVERWLKAPLQQPDGTLVGRDRGTPQGSAISPLLANLFMHYAFDAWMVREFPGMGFERYCDDAVVHCRSEHQARQVRDAIAARLAQVGLELHPDKTRIVYCKDADRVGSFDDGLLEALVVLDGLHPVRLGTQVFDEVRRVEQDTLGRPGHKHHPQLSAYAGCSGRAWNISASVSKPRSAVASTQ